MKLKALIYASLMFFTFIFSFYFTTAFLLKTQRTVVCPDVRGYNFYEAELALRKCGLELKISRYEKRNDVAKGLIVRQRPEPNVPVKRGRTVYVTISSGPELVIVPHLAGLKIETGENVLSEKRLKIGKKIFVPNKNEGTILAHIPGEREEVLEGEEITVIVGKKPRSFFVMPDISEWDLKEFMEELEAKGISYRVNYVRKETPSATSKVTVEKRPGSIFGSDETVEVHIFLGG